MEHRGDWSPESPHEPYRERATQRIRDVRTERTPACLGITPTGEDPALVLTSGGGASLFASTSAPGTGRLYLSQSGSFTEESSRKLELSPRRSTRIVLPDLGPDLIWTIRFDPPRVGSTELCIDSRNVPAATGP